MQNINQNVEVTFQNPPVPATENNVGEINEIKLPEFKITTITKRMAKLINTGNYQNTTIETSISADIANNEDIETVSQVLEKLLKLDLGRQELEVVEKVKKVEEEKKQEEIKQSEEVAAKMKKINIYKWVVSNMYGDQLTVSNDLHYEMICPRCGGKIEKRNGKNGEFYACSNYRTTGCKFTFNKQIITDFLNRVVEFLETTPDVPQPEKIYGYQTSQNYIEMDTTHALEPIQQEPQQVPVQQNQQQYVYTEEDLPF